MKIRWNDDALAELASGEPMREFIEGVGNKVRNNARANVKGHYPATRRDRAIVTESGTDEQSAYADVGYDKTQPGFVLFYSEVGTSTMSPRPHLRAALDQTRI